jgi:hypothetical protein
MKQYPIATSVGKFESWLQEYGKWKQEWFFMGNQVWYDRIDHLVSSSDNQDLGMIQFWVERSPDNIDLFYVSTKLYNGEMPPSDELIAYFNEMVAAIHEKWPQAPEPEQRGWQPHSEADKWLVHQFFEVHQGKRKSATFVGEWLRIRVEKDGLTDKLAHPADNVRQVIYKERKKRKKQKP